MRQKTERADAIAGSDINNALLRQSFAAIVGHAGRTDGQPATIQPQNDRRPLTLRQRSRRPNVQIQTIFAGRFFTKIMIDVVRPEDLDALGRKAIRIVDALPRLARLWLTPAQITRWRRGEWHTEVGSHTGWQQFAADIARVDCDRIAGNRVLNDLRLGAAHPQSGRCQQRAEHGRTQAQRLLHSLPRNQSSSFCSGRNVADFSTRRIDVHDVPVSGRGHGCILHDYIQQVRLATAHRVLERWFELICRLDTHRVHAIGFGHRREVWRIGLIVVTEHCAKRRAEMRLLQACDSNT